MPRLTKVAIIAALEREVRPLIKDWPVVQRQHNARDFRFFERNSVVVVCGGIGAEAARRATEAVISLYHPALVGSVGFAGALDQTLRVGSIFTPNCIIDAQDGSKTEIASGSGILLTTPAICGVAQKTKFARAYGAQAIDMEASAVARGAQSHGIPFFAVKSISDECGLELPPMERFIAPTGEFRTAAFALFITFRPWLWGRSARLARNSTMASKSLCRWLDEQDHAKEKLENSEPEEHLMAGEHSQPAVH